MAKVAFLTRGGAGWGMGHLHRTSWLAAALADQLHVSGVEINCVDSFGVRDFWTGLGFNVRNLSTGAAPLTGLLPQILENLNLGDLIVVDWLDSPADLIAECRSAGARVALLDDYGPARRDADLVINSLLAPVGDTKECIGNTQVVSGVSYVQLPPAVTKVRQVANAAAKAMEAGLRVPVEPRPEVRSVLVSFGGGYQAEVVKEVILALETVSFNGRVIVMPAPAEQMIPSSLDIEWHPSGPGFHYILAAVDLAVLGGGLSLYEALCFGVPSLAVALPSQTPGYEWHQVDTIRKLAAVGCCIYMGKASRLTAADMAIDLDKVIADNIQRTKMSLAGMTLIDGKGLDRSIELILELVTVSHI